MEERSRGSQQRHRVCYTDVYANGWQYGNWEETTTSDDPTVCARMILARSQPGRNVVGVRIWVIDGERMDVLYTPEPGEWP